MRCRRCRRRTRTTSSPAWASTGTPTPTPGGCSGFITGGDKLVIRGGFARTNDYQFLNLALNIASSFPFVGAINLAPSRQADGSNGVSSAFGRLPDAPVTGNPMLFTRTVVAEDFRAPILDQLSFELQRQMTENLVFRAGYIGTKGKDLFQSLEGNPILPFSTVREDPTRGLIRMRTNTGESTYHSLQLSAEQRFSKGFSAGLYYTWSSFKDDGSDTFNPSAGEVATPQDPHAIDDGEFAPSTYDRPHRFTFNFVWELPVLKSQQGFLGKIFGGWQISTLGTWQSGVPFTVFNGADPTGQHAGSLVGNPIRPNLNTDLDLSGMSIQEVLDAGGASLFSRLCGNPSPTCAGQRVGNAPRNLLRSDRLLQRGFRAHQEHAHRPEPQPADPVRDVQRDQLAQLRHPQLGHQLGQLPEREGDQRRQPLHLALGPLLLLSRSA